MDQVAAKRSRRLAKLGAAPREPRQARRSWPKVSARRGEERRQKVMAC